MTYQVINYILWCFVLAVVSVTMFNPKVSSASKQSKLEGLEMNEIDQCWRLNPEWRKHRSQRAKCSVSNMQGR